jgi:hypothetical protein
VLPLSKKIANIDLPQKSGHKESDEHNQLRPTIQERNRIILTT